jgi:transcriptional regulator with XRE-family HTH domain
MGGRSSPLQSARERIAFHVRALREVHGMSQERLGELAELHRTYIGSIERKERNLSIDNVERIAKVFGVDITALLARY